MQHLFDAGAKPPNFAFVGNVLKTTAQNQAFEYGGRLGEKWFLFDEHRTQTVGELEFAVVELGSSRQNGEKRTLSRTVSTDQSNAFSRIDGELGAVE